jgi:hypothetical protein
MWPSHTCRFNFPRLSPTTIVALFFVIIFFFFSSLLPSDDQGSKFPKAFLVYPLIVFVANSMFYFLSSYR